jgi:hypothetical protein
MVCAARNRKALYSHVATVPPFLLEPIRELTAEIQKTWSPRTRASRATLGRNRVSILIVLLRDTDNGHLREHD